MWLALEEKRIAYDTVLIDLRAKPEWSSLIPNLGVKLGCSSIYCILEIVARQTEAKDCWERSTLLAWAVTKVRILPLGT